MDARYVKIYLVFTCFLVVNITITECVVFHNLPANVSINEDYDQLKELLSISADCTYSTANFRCIRTAPTCPIITNSTVSCTECSITSNPDPTLFYIDNGKVFKRECSDPGCGVCSTCTSCGNLGNGCLDSRIQHRYLLHITCVTTEGDWENDSGTETLIVDVEQNPAPTINLDATVTVETSSSPRLGTVIFATSGVDPENEAIEYSVASGVDVSYDLGTPDLFGMHTQTKRKKTAGEVYVNGDLEGEFSQTLHMEICVNDRRNIVCGILSIELLGCFQRPTCKDNATVIPADYPSGDTLFMVEVPPPSDHFDGRTFSGLSYYIDSTTLDVAQIDQFSGIVNIHPLDFIMLDPNTDPNYFTIVVGVENADSCGYISTCTMELTVTMSGTGDGMISDIGGGGFESYQTLPIEVGFDPGNQVSLQEDIDSRELLAYVYVIDILYDDILYGPVTCELGNDADSSMFELYDNQPAYDYGFGYYYDSDYLNKRQAPIDTRHDVYRLYKKNCTDPGCGPVCAPNTGCMNYNIQSVYNISVTCWTSFGAEDTQHFTFLVERNNLPVLYNLPNFVFPNHLMSINHVVFTALYSDDGTDVIEFFLASAVPPSYILGTEDLFKLDSGLTPTTSTTTITPTTTTITTPTTTIPTTTTTTPTTTTTTTPTTTTTTTTTPTTVTTTATTTTPTTTTMPITTITTIPSTTTTTPTTTTTTHTTTTITTPITTTTPTTTTPSTTPTPTTTMTPTTTPTPTTTITPTTTTISTTTTTKPTTTTPTTSTTTTPTTTRTPTTTTSSTSATTTTPTTTTPTTTTTTPTTTTTLPTTTTTTLSTTTTPTTTTTKPTTTITTLPTTTTPTTTTTTHTTTTTTTTPTTTTLPTTTTPTTATTPTTTMTPTTTTTIPTTTKISTTTTTKPTTTTTTTTPTTTTSSTTTRTSTATTTTPTTTTSSTSTTTTIPTTTTSSTTTRTSTTTTTTPTTTTSSTSTTTTTPTTTTLTTTTTTPTTTTTLPTVTTTKPTTTTTTLSTTTTPTTTTTKPTTMTTTLPTRTTTKPTTTTTPPTTTVTSTAKTTTIPTTITPTTSTTRTSTTSTTTTKSTSTTTTPTATPLTNPGTTQPPSDAEEPSDNTAIIAGSIGGGLVLLGLLAALLKYLVAVCTNKAQTVQPMPSKPTPWALTETGKRSNMTNSTIPSPPNATLLPGQIHVHDPEILPGTKTNPYATAVTVEP